MVQNKTRLTKKFLATFIGTLLTIFLLTEARAEPLSKNNQGSRDFTYIPGELLVTYADQPQVSPSNEEVRKEVRANVEESIEELDAQLLSFPAVKEERPSKDRLASLERKKEALERDPRVESVDYNYVRKTLHVPDDPEFSHQWNLKTVGFPKAWNRADGRGVEIAVLDSGTGAQHPDLRGKVAAQKDFVDDDGVAEDSGFGHGTHVAGIAAAIMDNRQGIAGACPGCRLLVGRVIDTSGGTDSDIAEGIIWAADEGAEVINLSIGAPMSSDLLEDAVGYAVDKGAVVVVAAGNYGSLRNLKIYPAAYPAAIAVSATDRKGEIDPFSSYGRWVDVAAPGVDILSTLPGRKYGYDSGTSMAAPHVAALAGLLAGEGLNNSEIRDRIESTAVDLGAKGKDPYYGYGRIDALAAVGGTTAPEPRRCTITGTKGSDVLRGSARRDVICGLGGNDVVRGLGGNDTIYGDAGNDVVYGGPGGDRLVGGTGRDIMYGDIGQDRLYGGSGRDVLNVRDGKGGDMVDGDGGRDVCYLDTDDEVRRCP